MRFWPFRGRPAQPSADSSAFAIAELAPQLSGVLAVEQVRAEGHALAFGGRLLQSPQAAVTSLQPPFRSFGYTPFLQARNGLTWLRALPALWLGLSWSKVGPVPPGGAVVFGDSLAMRFMTWLAFGPLPPGHDVFVHPVALAGWVGLFVTALNLIPVGQLDGGRIAYALFGARHRQVSLAAFLALLVLAAVTGSA